ncbi:MAG: tetratricopeptide repeat protein [bacterium]|nr:tetratricopeptide repeat protein [bacterium]
MRVFAAAVVLLLALSGQDPVVAQDLEEAPPVASEGEALDLGGEEPATEELFEPGEVFVNANTVYEAGQYEEAVELYESLLDHGHENGHLHFNLGNAYLRNGELGRAIAAYRRSQVFLPRDQDVRANLEFARKSAKDALRPPAPDPVLATLFFWHYGLSRSELAVTVIVVNLLLWAVLILRLYRRGSEVLRWTFMVLLLLFLATLGSLVVHYLWPQEIAVIVPQEIEVRSGTNVQDVVLFKLHAGTEVRVVDRREGSIRIALPEEGKGGWIGQEHAEVVVE